MGEFHFPLIISTSGGDSTSRVVGGSLASWFMDLVSVKRVAVAFPLSRSPVLLVSGSEFSTSPNCKSLYCAYTVSHREEELSVLP